MSPEFAARLAHKLTASTGGWDDAGTTELIEEVSAWRYEQAAVEAVMSLCRTWTGYRPTLGNVIAAYNSAVDRQRMMVSSIPPPTESYPTFAVGIKAASEGYAAECRLQGREPDWSFFEKWVPGGPS